MAGRTDFVLLGGLAVRVDDAVVDSGHARQRCVLAALLVDVNRPLSVDRLVDRIWGERPPQRCRDVLYTYVSRLRRLLMTTADARLERRSDGYVLSAEPASIDLGRFRRSVAVARMRSGGEALADYESALANWGGVPFDGLESEWLATTRSAIQLELHAALLERNDVALRLGQHGRLLAGLVDLARCHPLDERVVAQLMLALYRCGRAAEALDLARRTRTVLAESLGIDPGQELCALELGILRDDVPSDNREAAGAAGGGSSAGAGDDTASVGRPIPAQLPPVPPDFTGRHRENRDLVAAAVEGVVTVQAISGKAGVGKSALAARVAEQLIPHFPDGQLHAELRGMSGSPTPPSEVLGQFLVALGIQVRDLPDTVDSRVRQFRTAVAGRRILLLLDDAAGEQQVRPLLPGGRAGHVLVTSRPGLDGLSGARQVDLDVLDAVESAQLLTRVAGPRNSADEETVNQVVRQCGGLPLALRVVGARVAGRRGWPLALLAERLADERRRLDELAAGDQEVRAAIALSHRGLDSAARRAFAWLGLSGLPDFPAWVVGICLDVDLDVGEQVVDRLVRAQLLDFARIDGAGQLRYRLHDLIGLYARECAAAEVGPDEQRAVVRRLAQTWLALVDMANARQPSDGFSVLERPVITEHPYPSVRRQVLARPAAWLTAEHDALVAIVEVAAAHDLDDAAVDLATQLATGAYLPANSFHAWSRTHHSALAASRRNGNQRTEAVLLAGLGQLRLSQDRYADARRNLERAMTAFRDVNDRWGEAATLAALGTLRRDQGDLIGALTTLSAALAALPQPHDLTALGHIRRHIGAVHVEQGNYPLALTHLRHALDAYNQAGSTRGQALVHLTLSWHHRANGELNEALAECNTALAEFTTIADTIMSAYALRSRAKTYIRLHRPGPAAPDLRQALRVARRAGDRWGQAATLRTIGELHLAAGRPAAAEAFLEASIQLWTTLDVALSRARTQRDLALAKEALDKTALAAAIHHEAMTTFHQQHARERNEVMTLADLRPNAGRQHAITPLQTRTKLNI